MVGIWTHRADQLSDSALRILNSVFGYDQFRGQQADIINHLISGGDALVLMPTGGGKSLCYQIPAIARPGVGIVVSPLIALMQNQVDRLLELGVRAAFLNSSNSKADGHRIEAQLLKGEIDLLYVAPERLLMPSTLALLKRVSIALIAVDEAHCISAWGHDFRKDYLELAKLPDEFPGVPRIALTATADERTRSEIVKRLNLQGGRTFVNSFNRPNIQYRVATKVRPRDQLLTFIEEEHPQDAGIVYCLSRKDVEQTAEFLQKNGKRAIAYHAGLDPRTRQLHLERFLKEEGIIVVATIAFGMGIDKPDVRFVAHLDLPKNLEAYYQETGRAGRDGEPATAWMVYGVQDAIMLRQMAESSDGDEAHKRIVFQKIQSILSFCEISDCRRLALLRYFGENGSEPCGNCDTCMEPVSTWDASIEAQKALSCIYRTQQRFGVGHLVDVLLGRDTERMRSLGHDKVSTFGIGQDRDERIWRSVFRQIVARGLVSVNEYGALQLLPSARPVIKGEERLLLRCESELPKKRSKSKRAGATKKGKKSRDSYSGNESNQDLFQALSRYRLQLAKSQDLPPYCIFHNSTLKEMAARKPSSLVELRKVSGVGDAKLAKYGEGFLNTIRSAISAEN